MTAPARTNSRTKPKTFSTASGDFLAFVEDVKRRETKPFVMGDRTFHLRGPALLTDAEVEHLNSTDGNVVDKARAVIDDYDGFAAAGGTAMLLMSYYDVVFDADAEGEDPASSSS